MKIDRLISIIMVLLNCEKISASELSARFEVTPRTIYRDIDTLSQAGIPIVSTPGIHGGIGLMPEYKIDKNFFTTEDISTLLMGLSSVNTTLSSKELTGTLEKVKSLLPKDRLQSIDLKSNQIRIDLTTWQGNPKLQEALETVKQALDSHHYLRITYDDKEGAQTSRKIEPYQLILKEGSWYLRCYCTLREDFRVFKLARLQTILKGKSTFIPRSFTNSPLSGEGWIDKKLISITLAIDYSLLDYMTERVGPDQIKVYKKDRWLVDFPFTEDDMGYNILLGLGHKCECLEPIYIREELKRRIQQLARTYSMELNG